jgi:hypothetical protein
MNATTREIIFERVGWLPRSISDIENMNYQRYLISAYAKHNFDFVIKNKNLIFRIYLLSNKVVQNKACFQRADVGDFGVRL